MLTDVQLAFITMNQFNPTFRVHQRAKQSPNHGRKIKQPTMLSSSQPNGEAPNGRVISIIFFLHSNFSHKILFKHVIED